MIELVSVKSLDEIQEQRETYMKELPYAQDLNIEENVWVSQYFKVNVNNQFAGYVCIDSMKTLWEFYLVRSACIYSQEIFKFLIDMEYIVSAECKTYDHLLLSLCFDFHKEAEGSAYLFRDYMDKNFPVNEYENIQIRLAVIEDSDILSKINKIDEDIEFFHDLKEDIENKEVYVFFLNNQLLGAGTCKKIWKSMNYRDIGMVVSEEHRNKGIGTFILIKLKEYCNNNDLIPVCGCWYYNYPSKKTLEKAGFLSRHRVIRFKF
jgi:hypothetical protein